MGNLRLILHCVGTGNHNHKIITIIIKIQLHQSQIKAQLYTFHSILVRFFETGGLLCAVFLGFLVRDNWRLLQVILVAVIL